MARRSLTLIFSLLSAAFIASIGTIVLLYFLVGREPSVP